MERRTDRLPGRKKLEAARTRLERRLRAAQASDALSEPERRREVAALRTAIGIIDRLAPRAAPVKRNTRSTSPRSRK